MDIVSSSPEPSPGPAHANPRNTLKEEALPLWNLAEEHPGDTLTRVMAEPLRARGYICACRPSAICPLHNFCACCRDPDAAKYLFTAKPFPSRASCAGCRAVTIRGRPCEDADVINMLPKLLCGDYPPGTTPNLRDGRPTWEYLGRSSADVHPAYVAVFPIEPSTEPESFFLIIHGHDHTYAFTAVPPVRTRQNPQTRGQDLYPWMPALTFALRQEIALCSAGTDFHFFLEDSAARLRLKDVPGQGTDPARGAGKEHVERREGSPPAWPLSLIHI